MIFVSDSCASHALSRAVCASPLFVRVFAPASGSTSSRAVRAHRRASFAHGHTWSYAFSVCSFARDAHSVPRVALVVIESYVLVE
jgi:hypothetical protein